MLTLFFSKSSDLDFDGHVKSHDHVLFTVPLASLARKMRALMQKRDTSGILDSSVFTCLLWIRLVWNFELASCCFSVGVVANFSTFQLFFCV